MVSTARTVVSINKDLTMLDLIAASLFVVFLLVSPHPVLFVVSAVLIWMSLNFRLFIIFRLPHRDKRKRVSRHG